MAVSRVIEERVGRKPLSRRTLLEHGFRQCRKLARREKSSRVYGERLLFPRPGDSIISLEDGGIPEQDAVEVLSIALRLHQRLAAPVRAAIKVRPIGIAAIIS